MLFHERRDGQGHHRHESGERLQQEDGLMRRLPDEGPETVERAPDGDPRQ